MNVGRIKLGVGVIGAAKHALEISAKYAKERHQFGKPIGTFGLVGKKLAEMAVRIFAGESMGCRTTALIDQRYAADPAHDAVMAIEGFAVEASMAGNDWRRGYQPSAMAQGYCPAATHEIRGNAPAPGARQRGDRS